MADDDEVKPPLTTTDVRAVPLTVAHALSVLKGEGWIRAEGAWILESIPELVDGLMKEAPELRLDYFERDEIVDLITPPVITFAWGCVRSALELLAGLDPPLLVVPKPRLSVVPHPVQDDDPPPAA
jgi:hypothetical protein